MRQVYSCLITFCGFARSHYLLVHCFPAVGGLARLDIACWLTNVVIKRSRPLVSFLLSLGGDDSDTDREMV